MVEPLSTGWSTQEVMPASTYPVCTAMWNSEGQYPDLIFGATTVKCVQASVGHD